MKTILLTILTCIIFSLSSNATSVISAVANHGDWNQNATWNLNRLPQTGDVVVIPEGITVEVSTNQYHSVPAYPTIQLYVYGVLQFVGTGQLNVTCESTITTMDNGSIPSTGCNCNQITMGPGVARWKGASATVENGNSVLSPCNGSLAYEEENKNVGSQAGLKNGIDYSVAYSVYSRTISIEGPTERIQFAQLLNSNGNEVSFQVEKNAITENKFLVPEVVSEGIYIVRFRIEDKLVAEKIYIHK